MAKVDVFPAKRMILLAATDNPVSFTDRLKATMEKTPEFKLWEPQKKNEPPKDGRKVIANMVERFWNTPEAIDYMKGRGFDEDVLRHFEIGYNPARDLLAVPMHDPNGKFPVGVIGRGLNVKKFANSPGLPTSKTLWNFHRAKKIGETVILTESSFDAMRVHQAGFPNVVASLGGNFSPHHFEQLDRTFNTIILMTDFDQKEKYIYENCRKCKKRNIPYCLGHNPGRDLGHTVAEGLRGKRVLWASHSNRVVYPGGAKDAGDLTDEEIRTCISNAVSNLEYNQWGLY